MILPSIVIVIAMAACIPQQGAVNSALCALGQQGDTATLSLTEDSWVFSNPADTMAANLVAYGGGTNVATVSESGEEFNNGIAWFLDDGGLDVEPGQEVEVSFTGTERSISVTYNREGQIEPFYCRIRE